MGYVDIVNTAGMICILTAFFLSIFKWIKNESHLYFILNIVGGCLTCYGSIMMKSVPFTILEGTWAVMAMIGFVKFKLSKV